MAGMSLATVRRVVAVGAHPDDIEIGAGGLLLTLPAGVRVHYVVCTGDDVRHDEARAAVAAFLPAAEVTVDLHTLPDGRLPAHWGQVKELLEAAAAALPDADLVLCPSLRDGHQDHRLLGELVPTAFRAGLVLQYEVPKWDGDLGPRNVYLPLPAGTARAKAQLLHRCFPSQTHRDWWDDEVFLGLARLRGMECRARYAEAYTAEKIMMVGPGTAERSAAEEPC